MRPRYAFILLLLILFSGCGRNPPEQQAPDAKESGEPAVPTRAAATPASLVLNWFPEMEHGGYYAGQLEGYYTEGGVALTIIPGGAGTQVVPQVATGRVDFGVINADNLVQARSEGVPLVALLAPIQISPRCIIVHEAGGITRLEDLRDLTIAMNAASAFAVYLQKHAALPGVTIVPYSGNTAQFLLDAKFAQQGYVFSEPYIIRQKGGDPRSLPLADIGFNPYTSILVTSEKMLAEHPETVHAVTAGAAKGWMNYFEKPEPVNRHINSLNPEMAMDVLAYGVETLRPLALTTETRTLGAGCMTEERWSTLIRQMEEIGMVPAGSVKSGEIFDTRFVPALKPETGQ